MFALAIALLGFSLPLYNWRSNPLPPLPTLPTPKRFTTRRAPLAEHGWESHVLCNLTRSD